MSRQDLEQVVFTALAKDPKDRFASMRAFVKAFEQACSSTGAIAPSSYDIPSAGPSSVGQPGNVISTPSAPSGSAPSSNWPSFSNVSESAAASARQVGPYPEPSIRRLQFLRVQPPSPCQPALSLQILPCHPAPPRHRSIRTPIFFPPQPSWDHFYRRQRPRPQIPFPHSAFPPQDGKQPTSRILQPGWQSAQLMDSSGPLQTGPTILSSGQLLPILSGQSPVHSPCRSPSYLQHLRTGISRRKFLVAGVAGAAGLAVVGGGITWFVPQKSHLR